MQTFASQPVMTQMQASSNAHMKAMAAYNEVASMQAVEARPPLEGAEDALATAPMAVKNADDAVVEAIRIELQGNGKPPSG
jgi:hypothetical protein